MVIILIGIVFFVCVEVNERNYKCSVIIQLEEVIAARRGAQSPPIWWTSLLTAMKSLGLLAAVFSCSTRAWLPMVPRFTTSLRHFSGLRRRTRTALPCIGTQVTKPNEESTEEDIDLTWRSIINPDIVPVHREPFTVRPQLITFDAMDTLIEPSQSIGRWYREALNIACDMRIRLPRPALFADAFKKAYSEM